MEDFWELMDTTWQFIKDNVFQLVMAVIFGALGTRHSIVMSGVKLTNAQKVMRYSAGMLLAFLVPLCINSIYELSAWFNPLLGFMVGNLGLDGMTRIIVTYIQKHKKQDK